MEIIHIVLGKANPDRLNGVNKVVHQIASQQAFYKKNVSVYGISETGKNQEFSLDFPLTIFQSYSNPFKLDKDLKLKIQSNRKDAIYILHGSWIPRFYSLSRFLNNNGCKYITMQHGGYNNHAMQKSSLIKKVYFNLFEKTLLKNAQAIHCIGESELEGLESLNMAEKGILIPYGFEKCQFSIDQKEKTESIFCYMGRLDNHTKGLDLLITAFSNVQSLRPEAKLWIIGSGKGLEKLKELVSKYNLDEHVVFWGALFGEEKFQKMAQSTVFVHPSRFEGLPSAILEAATIGLPIIATQATNMAKFIAKHNAGWWIANNNDEALSKAMMTSIKESKYFNKMRGENAISMVEMEFAWDKVLLEMDKMYADAQI